jgi:hypothetical protein
VFVQVSQTWSFSVVIKYSFFGRTHGAGIDEVIYNKFVFLDEKIFQLHSIMLLWMHQALPSVVSSNSHDTIFYWKTVSVFWLHSAISYWTPYYGALQHIRELLSFPHFSSKSHPSCLLTFNILNTSYCSL